jgi:hypothetical protein
VFSSIGAQPQLIIARGGGTVRLKKLGHHSTLSVFDTIQGLQRAIHYLYIQNKMTNDYIKGQGCNMLESESAYEKWDITSACGHILSSAQR